MGALVVAAFSLLAYIAVLRIWHHTARTADAAQEILREIRERAPKQ